MKGYYKNKNIFIGMGRLKIIDLKSQNLCPYEDDKIVCLTMVRLYYLELRKELKSYNWNSKPRQILRFANFEAVGYKMFQKLNGMFGNLHI